MTVLLRGSYTSQPMTKLTRSLAIGCAGTMCALTIAACGSSSNKAHAAAVGSALKFSSCMRAHGVTNFPDPSAGGGLELNGSGVNPQSPTFQSAQTACAKFQPGGSGPPKMSASQRRAAVKFAECMRTHGEPNFPDPVLATPKGAVAVLVLRGMEFAFQQPINPQAPAFKQAASACGVRGPGASGA